MAYLQQFACFKCRKAFKYEVQRDWWAVKSPQAKTRNPEQVVCPDCGEKMWLMGRKFKAPKRNNLKQWLKVEKIRKTGLTRFPKYVWQAANFIDRYNAMLNPPSEGAKLLKKINGKRHQD
jgi:DNA-directed RNA polymerase subunit RPC12/RpoP